MCAELPAGVCAAMLSRALQLRTRGVGRTGGAGGAGGCFGCCGDGSRVPPGVRPRCACEGVCGFENGSVENDRSPKGRVLPQYKYRCFQAFPVCSVVLIGRVITMAFSVRRTAATGATGAMLGAGGITMHSILTMGRMPPVATVLNAAAFMGVVLGFGSIVRQ